MLAYLLCKGCRPVRHKIWCNKVTDATTLHSIITVLLLETAIMITVANVGQTDKMLRIIAGLILGVISFVSLGGFGSGLGIVSLLIAAVLIVTGALNFCPAYKILGVNTQKKSV